MAEVKDFEALRIILASPENIKEWSFGEVTKPETINYRTLKPEKDGLFCERIFGPTKDWECYCGKYKRIRYRGVICDKCGVEVTQAKVRRERMAHITLAAPAAHVWFFKGTPSKLSQLLDVSPRNLDSVIYFAQYLVINADEDKRKEALGKLETQLAEKSNGVRETFAEKISSLEEELKEEKKKLDIKDKEHRDIVIEELELKAKNKIASLREEQAAEITRAEEIYKTISEKVKGLTKLSLLSEEEYFHLLDYDVSDFVEVGMGAEALLKVLGEIDLAKLTASLREEITTSTGQKQVKAVKRLRVAESLKNAEVKPAWMILQTLPVIPPDLRPMVQLSGGRFATSDLNDLYRRVINRNNRLKRLMDLGAPEIILRNEKRMLQEAVDALIDSSQRPTTRALVTQELRSLSDMLRGKQGRFRQNLLGKRVDYSGRSVIIVGPELGLNQCKLPKEMALELFKPYVLRELIFQGYAPNVKSAKHVFERRGTEVWDILESITKNHPVLLNRAPTLHRLGIQAFYPVLTEGSAIGIHPSVCAGYGADFDGDQMAVHVPLSTMAQEDAVNLMMSNHNLLRPADGEPIMTPKQDVFLGCYYITMMESGVAVKGPYSPGEAILAYQSGNLGLNSPIKVRMSGEEVETTVGRIIFNEALPEKLRFVNKLIKGGALKKLLNQCHSLYGQERTVQLIDDLKDLGFKYATISGISMAVTDCEIIPQKAQLIAEGDKKVEEIEKSFKKGLITAAEKARLSEEVWAELTSKIDELTWQNLAQDNSLRILQESGARGSRDQIKQLAGMRGLVTDPMGRIVELPSKSNFREGLDVYEYFTSTRGARKGLVDKALKTAEAGYLTRRLVDVAHDVLIRTEDCGTKEGVKIIRVSERSTPFGDRVLGRVALEDIKAGKKVLVKANEEIDEEKASEIEKSDVTEVVVRSPLTCEAKYGICALCYGRDLTTKEPVKIGTPVGVIAAQSIGEPGTQLTMRTFHLGGIVGLDITQGLPRVEELFESRSPKTPAVISEIPGKVSVIEADEGRKVRITMEDKAGKQEKEYIIPAAAELKVSDGDLVGVGQPLTGGHLDLRVLLETRGIKAVQQYIISEVQKVYESQGAPINDKHFEVIIRKMSEKVRVETQGDTTILPGELVDRTRFVEENARVLAAGGEPATAQIVILGITKAALFTESVLSAASFQETTTILTDAAVSGKVDRLLGLKENVIIGRLIPIGDRARID
ncbi:MAG: DNA-directed RNA polymerase subunit beta' [Patescibacteria group bacterium]|nr:DNA-directed RNA polymerase subunit beta' [Patescibacteria group bacterium]